MDSCFIIDGPGAQDEDSLSLRCFPAWSGMLRRAPRQSPALGHIHPGEPGSLLARLAVKAAGWQMGWQTPQLWLEPLPASAQAPALPRGTK